MCVHTPGGRVTDCIDYEIYMWISYATQIFTVDLHLVGQASSDKAKVLDASMGGESGESNTLSPLMMHLIKYHFDKGNCRSNSF